MFTQILDDSLSTLDFVAHNIWAVDLEPRTLHCFTVPMEGPFIGEIL